MATQPPPPLDLSRKADACEICLRDWIPLTYHHLIPCQVHAKALKRRWHEEWQLNSVAWLCRACHSLVHRIASNEELAREWWTIERLVEREDVQDFALWIGMYPEIELTRIVSCLKIFMRTSKSFQRKMLPIHLRQGSCQAVVKDQATNAIKSSSRSSKVEAKIDRHTGQGSISRSTVLHKFAS